MTTGQFHDLYLTPKGKTVFSFIVAPGYGASQALVKFKSKRHVIEITGITEAGSGPMGTSPVREVEFTWNYTSDGWPSVLKPCLNPPIEPSKYVANFMLYDDGWRLIQRQ
jgi:hypothetical protein